MASLIFGIGKSADRPDLMLSVDEKLGTILLCSDFISSEERFLRSLTSWYRGVPSRREDSPLLYAVVLEIKFSRKCGGTILSATIRLPKGSRVDYEPQPPEKTIFLSARMTSRPTGSHVPKASDDCHWSTPHPGCMRLAAGRKNNDNRDRKGRRSCSNEVSK